MSTATPLLVSPPRIVEPTLALAPPPGHQAQMELALLEAWLSSAQALQLPLHQVARQQQPKGREVQRLLLPSHIQRRGNGDLGPALRVKDGTGEVRYTHRRLRIRSRKPVFGPIEIARMGYACGGAHSIYPLDEALALP